MMVGRRLRRRVRRWGIRLLLLAALWLCFERGWLDLPFVPERLDQGESYDRNDWSHWVDADHDCQDTRQEVLIEESRVPVRWADHDRCRVRRGRWRCPYTGRVFTDPGKLDVDHLVPLHAAHRSGGDRWTAERKRAYANALGDAEHLVAVSASANRRKGDKGPDAWLPPDPEARCDYVRSWTAVKSRWGLQSSPAEVRAVERITRECDAGRIPARP